MRFLDSRRAIPLAPTLGLLIVGGCYAPLHSPGIPASSLPDSYRVPAKARGVEINYAMLTRQIPREYVLGPDDVITVEVSDVVPDDGRAFRVNGHDRSGQRPFSYRVESRVSELGDVLLPLVGPIQVGDMTLEQARQQIIAAYANGFYDDPQVAVSLLAKKTTRVMVVGSVAKPDVYELAKYENDVAHAITRAGGLTEEADEIQVHRRTNLEVFQNDEQSLELLPDPTGEPQESPLEVLQIPLRSCPPVMITPDQAELNDGDVVVVRTLPDEVFFVVGKLSPNNFVRFTLGREDRDLGNGFVLPKDRDVDVVTAVAMAGYIDPIDSPTTVTVHRTKHNGKPILIHVDLIAARFDRKENIMVRAGDIIYLNPDGGWWFRRTLDRVIPDILTSPYSEAMEKLINPNGSD